MVISVDRKVENIREKVENTGYQNFLFFPYCLRASFSELLKSELCGKRL